MLWVFYFYLLLSHFISWVLGVGAAYDIFGPVVKDASNDSIRADG